MNQQLITVARVVRPQGRRGEVIAELYTNLPEQVAASNRLTAITSRGEPRELEVEAHWFHKQRVVLKFRGVESISQAEELRGCELKVRRDQLVQLEEHSYYVGDLVGCAVFDRQTPIGEVAAVQFGAGDAPLLVVRNPAAGEYLVPFAYEYLRTVDLKGKRIQMVLPERLLEVNAPLDREEKGMQNQRRKARRSR